MDIEKRKVERAECFSPEIKKRYFALFGVSTAVLMSACSTTPKMDSELPLVGDVPVSGIPEPAKGDSTTVSAKKDSVDSVFVCDHCTAGMLYIEESDSTFLDSLEKL